MAKGPKTASNMSPRKAQAVGSAQKSPLAFASVNGKGAGKTSAKMSTPGKGKKGGC